ncbi:MAG: succinylglutamate desuccinylase/aspartoacylase family protein [Dongiaceae bacterium]
MRAEPIAIAVGADEAGMATGLVGARYRLGDSPRLRSGAAGTAGPRVLATACVHGDEVTSTGALWYVAERLADPGSAEGGFAAASAPLGGSVTLIPCANQLAMRASTREIPLEGADLNRAFPGRADGTLAERLAAALVALLDEHDALIDVHTAGWATPFVLLDHIADAALRGRVVRWAGASGLPVVGEMPAEQSDLKGLDRSWSAWAVRLGKPAVTLELSGFHTLESATARRGAEAVLAMLAAAPQAVGGGGTAAGAAEIEWRRTEIHAGSGGLFEALRRPGESIAAGERLGVVRSMLGEAREVVTAPADGLILALQPISAVHVGSWLATLAVRA